MSDFPPKDVNGVPITLGCYVQYVTGVHPNLQLECMQVREIVKNDNQWVLNGLHINGLSCTLVGTGHVSVVDDLNLPPVEDLLSG